MERITPLLILLAASPMCLADTVHGIIGYGQSLSLGNQGCPRLSATQPYSNLMLSGSSLVALIENTACNLGGGTMQESPNAAAANTITLLDGTHAWVSATSLNGVAGTAIVNLQSGSGPYSTVLASVTAAKAAAVGAGRGYDVIAIMFTHGESDWLNSSITYGADLRTLQQSLNTDIKAITGQSANIPMYISQFSAVTANSLATNLCPDATVACANALSSSQLYVPLAQFQAAIDYPDEILMVGPKYQLTYADGGLHLDNVSYHAVGTVNGKAMKRKALDGVRWTGLMPRSITRSGTTVTAQFWLPNTATSLVLDTTTLPQPLRNGITATDYGFQFFDNATAEIAVTGVSLTSTDTFTITLASAPSGTGYLAYAFEGTRYAASSTAGFMHGNVRDNDSTLSPQQGATSYNWLPTFRVALPFAWLPTIPPPGSAMAGASALTGKVSR